MRSRIEPMKKIARLLRDHREPILDYFRAHKLRSSGVVEGTEQQGKSHDEKIIRLFAPSVALNSPSITHLKNCPKPNPPTSFF